MKTFRIIFSVCLAMILFACNDDSTPKKVPGDISNVRAEPLEGQVVLRWDVPSEPDYYYVRVSYYDKALEREVSKTVSIYNDSLLVDDMLNRYGEYDFTLQTFSEDEVGGPVHKLSQACEPVAPYTLITDEEGVEVPLVISMLSSKSVQTGSNARPLDNIIDRILAHPNFYHSLSGDPWPQWIQIDLKEELLAFRFEYYTRPQQSNGDPNDVDFEVSQDGINWTIVKNFTDELPQGSGTTPGKNFNSGAMLAPFYFKHLRMVVHSSYQGNTYFNLDDIYLFECGYTTYDAEKDEIITGR